MPSCGQLITVSPERPLLSMQVHVRAVVTGMFCVRINAGQQRAHYPNRLRLITCHIAFSRGSVALYCPGPGVGCTGILNVVRGILPCTNISPPCYKVFF